MSRPKSSSKMHCIRGMWPKKGTQAVQCPDTVSHNYRSYMLDAVTLYARQMHICRLTLRVHSLRNWLYFVLRYKTRLHLTIVEVRDVFRFLVLLHIETK